MTKSEKRSQTTINVKFMEYENITLKMFLDLSESKNYRGLVTEGEATDAACAEAWEKIVKHNSEVSGNLEMGYFLSNYKAFAQLLADFNAIKATLNLLLFFVDNGYIKWLSEKNFKIVTDKGNEAYMESINAAMRRSDNYITRIKMKQNELIRNGEGRPSKKFGFEELIANLTMILGFEVNDNVTLARYNEYNKLIAKKNRLK